MNHLFVAAIALIAAVYPGTQPDRQPQTVDSVLDALHTAAAEADQDTYFALFTDDAVFLGTDATERWTIDQFREFAMPYFQRESAWTYKPVERHIMFDDPDNPRTAWFDELLENDAYGLCRGTGVLRRIDDRWRIAHYSLSFTIPNESAADVVRAVRAHQD